MALGVSETDEASDRTLRWPRIAGSALAVLVLAAAVIPPIRAGLKAPGVLAESLDRSWPRPLAPDVERRSAVLGGVAGEVYSPRPGAPPVLLLPGATPAGLGDVRAVRAATAIARAGRTVFIPELTLYEEDLDPQDIERIVRAGAALADRSHDGRIAVVGFSFGGSMALLAAAEDDLRDRVAVIGTFGAYWDLEGYAQAAATGVSIIDGRRVTWSPHPRAPEIFREQVLRFADEDDRRLLEGVLAGDHDAGALSPDASALHDFVTHDDPTRTGELLDALPDQARDHLRRLSPSTVADRITAPVIALHDRDDPAVPYGEALRLAHGLPHARVHTVELFEHVDLDADRAWHELLGDLAGTWRLARGILAAQERLWPR
jgi:pimeloyl-ACP methyl ester carboxylesterase